MRPITTSGRRGPHPLTADWSMADLPHFLPYRMAYEVNYNFPLSYLTLSRTDNDNYLLRFEVRRNHPIYKPTGMTIRIDMNYVEKSYPDPELCVIECLDALIKVMTNRIRPNTKEMMLRECIPWMNLPNYSYLHPKIIPSADTSQPEPTQE
jgi:hypothetical protein